MYLSLRGSSYSEQHDKPVVADEESQGEGATQTNTEEDTSCKSNSTIEPAAEAAEPTESATIDNKLSPTGNNNNNDQIQNDPADTTHTESEVHHWLIYSENLSMTQYLYIGYSSNC